MIYWLDLFGTAVFAITGCLSVRKKGLDLFGIVIIAMVTALGGGTIRDLVLGIRPVFWVTDPNYIYVAVVAAIFTFIGARFRLFPAQILLVADAFGLAVFTVLGIQTALQHEAPLAIAMLMGVISGTAGGMIRDALSGEIPLILRSEIYATASLCGAIVYVVVSQLLVLQDGAVILGILTTFVLRLAALHWKLALPRFMIND